MGVGWWSGLSRQLSYNPGESSTYKRIGYDRLWGWQPCIGGSFLSESHTGKQVRYGAGALTLAE